MRGMVLIVTLFLIVSPPRPASAQTLPGDLTKLSLEELMNIEVTSATKREQRLFQVAAAIYVITQEDIHRSGATSIPEALRMVPGMNVAQINANTWAVSARGFNSRFANKLLVLIDGRTVYAPLFSGVYWDVQDTVLEDIDRIEVIRGPAGTLWGANAVNGVINIITKSAKDTQGGLVSAGGGTEEQGFGSFRYGGKLGQDFHYRVFAKGFLRDDFSGGGSGRDAHDEWKSGRWGIRGDWNPTDRDSLTFLGNYYGGQEGDRILLPTLTPPFSKFPSSTFDMAGGNLLARWQRRLSGDAEFKAQLYYDRTERLNIGDFKEFRDTFDLELQHGFKPADSHSVTWGLGYRLTTDALSTSAITRFHPSRRADPLVSSFVQDEITLAPERWRLTLGAKFEFNDYTGFEIQPSARLLWTPHEHHTFWAAVSRAVRTPSRFEDSVNLLFAAFPCPPFFCKGKLFGNRGLSSESVQAHELGYRAQLTSHIFVDVSTFYNIYRKLIAGKSGAGFFAGGSLVLPLISENRRDNTTTYGLELAANWNPTNFWKWSFGYTLLKVLPKTDPLAEGADGDHPKHQFHLRSLLNLPYNFQFDNLLYYVDHLAKLRTPGYVRFDTRLGWQATRNLELGVVGQNLFDHRHREFGATPNVNPTSVERSVFGKLTIRF